MGLNHEFYWNDIQELDALISDTPKAFKVIVASDAQDAVGPVDTRGGEWYSG